MSREIILSTVSFHLPSRKETLESNLERAHEYVEEAMERDSDDECRVFYVGATRARETLHIVQPQREGGFII